MADEVEPVTGVHRGGSSSAGIVARLRIPGGVTSYRRCTLAWSVRVQGTSRAEPEEWMQARDPKSGQPPNRPGQPPNRPGGQSSRSGTPTGRPAFGIGPIARVSPSPLANRPGGSTAPGTLPLGGRSGFGLPNLRRNVCPHFYMTGTRGAIPIQAPHLLKALIRQDQNISRCQLRGGVHLEQGYVNDVCLTPRFNQCVFYEDELTRE
jgi:hypothetical protein